MAQWPKMRRVVARYYENSAARKLLHERLGAPLDEVSWSRAHAAWLNLEEKVYDPDLPERFQRSLLAEISEQEEPSQAVPGVGSGASMTVPRKLSPLELAERRLRAVQKECSNLSG